MDHEGFAFRYNVAFHICICRILCTGLSCFIYFQIMRLDAFHCTRRNLFLSGSAATPWVHLDLNNDAHWMNGSTFIWNVWGPHLICQAQRWEEDHPDNKLMKMSLTCTSISVFHMGSTEHINIVARQLQVFPPLLSTILYWMSCPKGHQGRARAFISRRQHSKGLTLWSWRSGDNRSHGSQSQSHPIGRGSLL